MGLDTSHDCWHGPYSAFMRWRTAVAKAVGIELMAMEGYAPNNGKSWDKADPITTLLNHSDCDGEIAARDCLPLAERLEGILPLLDGYNRETAQRFIDGLRAAATANEDVVFA